MSADLAAVTQVLKTADTGIKSIRTKLEKVQPLTVELSLDIKELEDHFARLLSVEAAARKVVACLSIGLDLFSNLAVLIPDIGPALSEVAKVIKDSPVLSEVKAVLDKIDAFFKEMNPQKTLQEIKKGSRTIFSALENLTTKSASWQESIDVSLTVVNAVESLDNSTWPTNDMLGDISKLFKDVGTEIELLEANLEKLDQFFSGQWLTLKSYLVNLLSSGLEARLKQLQDLAHELDGIIDVCDSIKHCFEPLEKVIACFNWLWDHTVGWLIKQVTEELHLDILEKKFSAWILEFSGVKHLEDTIHGVFDALLNPIHDAVQTFAGMFDVKAIHCLDNLEAEFASKLMEPVESIIKRLNAEFQEAIPAVWIDPDIPWDDPSASKDVPAASITSVTSDWTSKAGIRTLTSSTVACLSASQRSESSAKAIQKWMDLLASKLDHATQTHVENVKEQGSALTSFYLASSATESVGPPDEVKAKWAATHFGDAFYNDTPIAVLLRVSHKQAESIQSIHTPTSSSSMNPSATIQTTTSSSSMNPSATIQRSTPDPSSTQTSLQCPSIHKYNSLFATLQGEVEHAISQLEIMRATAKQADANFAKFAPGIKDFCDHLVELIGVLAPEVQEMEELVAVLVSYREALQAGVDSFLASQGMPELLSKGVAIFFDVMDAFDRALKFLREDINENKVAAEKLASAFKTAFVSASASHEVASALESGPSGFERSTVNFQQRIKGTLTTFTLMQRVSEKLLARIEEKTWETPLLQAADTLFAQLCSAILASTESIRATGTSASKMNRALIGLQQELLETTSSAAKITSLCRIVERKVISSKDLKEVLKRAGRAIGAVHTLVEKIIQHADPATPASADPSSMALPQASSDFRWMKNAIHASMALSDVSTLMHHLSENLAAPKPDNLSAFNEAYHELLDCTSHPSQIATTGTDQAQKISGNDSPPLLTDDSLQKLKYVCDQMSTLPEQKQKELVPPLQQAKPKNC